MSNIWPSSFVEISWLPVSKWRARIINTRLFGAYVWRHGDVSWSSTTREMKTNHVPCRWHIAMWPTVSEHVISVQCCQGYVEIIVVVRHGIPGRWKCETGKCGTGKFGNRKLRHVWHNLVFRSSPERWPNKPGKMSVRPYVRTSTMKHNAATNQIVVFAKVDETFTTIWLSRSSEVSVKVRRWPRSPFGAIFCTCMDS